MRETAWRSHTSYDKDKQSWAQLTAVLGGCVRSGAAAGSLSLRLACLFTSRSPLLSARVVAWHSVAGLGG